MLCALPHTISLLQRITWGISIAWNLRGDSHWLPHRLPHGWLDSTTTDMAWSIGPLIMRGHWRSWSLVLEMWVSGCGACVWWRIRRWTWLTYGLLGRTGRILRRRRWCRLVLTVLFIPRTTKVHAQTIELTRHDGKGCGALKRAGWLLRRCGKSRRTELSDFTVSSPCRYEMRRRPKQAV